MVRQAQERILISISPPITMSLMSHHLIGISAMPRARLSRWNNPAAGGYWCWGQMGDAGTNPFANILRSRRARTRSAIRCRASGSLRPRSGSAFTVRVQPFRSRPVPPIRCRSLILPGAICILPSPRRARWCLLAFEAKPTERPVEAQFANLSLNSGATDVPVDADETSDEERISSRT